MNRIIKQEEKDVFEQLYPNLYAKLRTLVRCGSEDYLTFIAYTSEFFLFFGGGMLIWIPLTEQQSSDPESPWYSLLGALMVVIGYVVKKAEKKRERKSFYKEWNKLSGSELEYLEHNCDAGMVVLNLYLTDLAVFARLERNKWEVIPMRDLVWLYQAKRVVVAKEHFEIQYKLHAVDRNKCDHVLALNSKALKLYLPAIKFIQERRHIEYAEFIHHTMDGTKEASSELEMNFDKWLAAADSSSHLLGS